ncbi:TatD family hydrolase [Thiorhodococcus mannitoliphagus]|uniref:TatD family hydrolase n=1 Tax=Thiorhodococcus mannitoliphagus TaxID=329406 RepID=A0A6P1DZ49_9GAMM|nr:TatD family hydrolase [Thiorhodococcus mannitoliphagus]NEX22760.1 TatD family hydrolase [Thiorhodococcus mannitoliphagus]
MELIDTHCHLDVSDFDTDRSRVLSACREAGLTAIVVPAIQAQGWEGLLATCADAQMPRLYPALGLHPLYVRQHRERDLVALEQAVRLHRPLAIGEIGLDFQVRELDPAAQRHVFESQLAIARDARLPVLLHVRKAHDEVLAMLRRAGVPGGIAHAFNGSLQQGLRYIDLGFKLGFGGMLTFERSRKLRRLAAELPLASIVLETDAPDMTVAAHQGERNSPEYLPDVLAALAATRKADPEAVAAQTTANARGILNLQ